ncbi:hypothetical protein C8R47DRAFT_1316176 [Mycena vitilis]|nr:hypothetical protein C8R47DRAFT_1316176 [Mycena vitilis]
MPPPPTPSSSSQRHGQGGVHRGPQIYAPPNHAPQHQPLFPRLTQLPANPGYQEAHSVYEEMRSHFQNKAYSQGNTQTMLLRCWLATLEPRRATETLIHDIYRAVDHIPVNVGAGDLKSIVYHALLPQIVTWLRGYPVDKIEFTLRKQHWLEIVPTAFPDVNAIADDFFTVKPARGGGVTRTFNNKKPAKLYLGIDTATHQAILEYFDSLDNPDPIDVEASTNVADSKASRSKGKRKAVAAKPRVVRKTRSNTRATKSAAVEDTSYDDLFAPNSSQYDDLFAPETSSEQTVGGQLGGTSDREQRTPSPPSKRQKMTELMVSPEASNIRKALSMQVPLKPKALKPLFNNVSRDFLVHILPSVAWASAISTPDIFSDLTQVPPCHTTIYYNTKTEPVFGGFKSAFPGVLGIPILGPRISTSVCLKQGFYVRPDDGTKVLYDQVSQITFLGGELNLLGWGTAMMNLVYHYIAGRESRIGKPAFEVPKMRFVHAGLAIGQTNDNRDSFIVEEWIDPETEGPFVKYIHNRSARPRSFPDAEHSWRAKFLSFAQHVQFLKTDKMAYISDFQGGYSLLTDPQIISDPDLSFRRVFGDGNTNYDALKNEHDCNEFCEFYGVPKEVFGRTEPSERSPPSIREISPSASLELEFPPGLARPEKHHNTAAGPSPSNRKTRTTNKQSNAIARPSSRKNAVAGPSSNRKNSQTDDFLYHT